MTGKRRPPPSPARLRGRAGAGTILALGLAILFLAIWGQVLIGSRVLIGADVLYAYPPWSANPGAHNATNWLASDPVREFVPWLQLEWQAFRSGRLPLWDSMSMSGRPLFANDISSSLSPFTWLAFMFGGYYGYSLAMLAKLWVAGLGTVVFLRLLGVRPLAAGMGGLSYGTCSYAVLWLAWPHSSVAALMPWVFAAAEWYLRCRGPGRLALVPVAVGAQFLAGHPESSLILGEGVGAYVLIRCLDRTPGRLKDLVALAAAGVLGGGVAAVQLFPFLAEFFGGSIGSNHAGVGLIHLTPGSVSSWIVPNLRGNPGIDGLLGRPPHYNMTTAFAGVAAAVLAGVGAVARRQGSGSVRAALVTIALVSAGVVYGPLTGVAGRLPILSVTFNFYMVLLICFAVAVLAGLGLDALMSHEPRRSPSGTAALVVGLAGLASVAGLALVFVALGKRAELLVPPLPPPVAGGIGFWVLVGAASLLAAVALTAAGRWRANRIAVPALLVLAAIEAGLFAGPYQPQLPVAEVPPSSAAAAWLSEHAGGRPVAATGLGTLIPEAGTLYGIADVRGYDVVRPPGMKRFWSLADPGYYDDGLQIWLDRPGADWLAAAGVPYVVTPGDEPLPGTEAAYRGEGVTIGSVPNARPPAFAAADTICARSQDEAAGLLAAAGPLGPVVLQRADCPGGSPAAVHIVSSQPGRIEMLVTADRPTVVVVLQSYTPDWVVTVDGKVTPDIPADLQFQAAGVPAGTHRVVFAYAPASVVLGGWISVAALLVTAALAAVAWVRARRRRVSSLPAAPSSASASPSGPAGTARRQ